MGGGSRNHASQEIIRPLLDLASFCEEGSGLRLRRYQQEAGCTIVQSVLQRLGLSVVVLFPRQSGKNELQAQIESYLLLLFSLQGGEIVKISPTWRPQSLNAMRRLEQALQRNRFTRLRWAKETGHIYRIGQAQIVFLSGAPTSNIVGATARTLLSCDEAQDVTPEKWDKEINPMAAAYNATRVFWGTAWTAQTLLGRELRQARLAQARDGRQRAFIISAEQVAQEVPAYGEFVEEQVRRLGRNHPMVRTQFFSEELDGESALFNPHRLALMQGDHPARAGPEAGKTYAMLIDVGGEETVDAHGLAADWGDFAGQETTPQRDSTALTVVEVDLLIPNRFEPGLPTYRVVHRRVWTGEQHTALYDAIQALVHQWQAVCTVIDATGVGAGLASFLQRALGNRRLIPFQFTAASKSELGWRFLGIIETGRYREFQAGLAGLPEQDQYQSTFWEQARACQSQLVPGPNRLLRWGVPERARLAHNNALIHDDFLVSAALCAALDRHVWGAGQSILIPGEDILAGLRPAY
jgi:hypothetical protein